MLALKFRTYMFNYTHSYIYRKWKYIWPSLCVNKNESDQLNILEVFFSKEYILNIRIEEWLSLEIHWCRYKLYANVSYFGYTSIP